MRVQNNAKNPQKRLARRQRPDRNGSTGYHRTSADGTTVLVPSSELPVGRVPDSQGRSNRLLVLSCSARKKTNRRPLQALDRYDGPAFRVLRKYLRSVDDASLRVCVLSAKYGVIAGDAPIPDYNQEMTSIRADVLRGPSKSQLLKVIQRERCGEAFLCMSRLYLRAIGCTDALGVRVRIAAEGQGKKLASLKAWLAE